MFGWLVSLLVSGPRFRGRGRLQRVIPHLPYTSSRTAYGVRMRRNRGDATYQFALMGAYGDFLSSSIEGIKTPFVFLDIGANQGLFSLLAAKNPACGQVVAFEPNPFVFSLLVENIQLNAAAVEPICAAITDQPPRFLDLHWQPGHSGRGSVAPSARGTVVQVVGIDREFLSTLRLEAGLPLVVKIDVEGHEVSVLRELFGSDLGVRIDTILVEVSSHGGSDEQGKRISDLLNSHGFEQVSQFGPAAHYDAVFRRQKGTASSSPGK